MCKQSFESFVSGATCNEEIMTQCIGRPRFRSLRKKHLTQTCLHPKARPRHESIDVKLYTDKRKEKYLDFFQVGGNTHVKTNLLSFDKGNACYVYYLFAKKFR